MDLDSKGIHQVKVEGVIDGGAEWELTFELPPRRLEVKASAWNVTGLHPQGPPENQLLFVRKDTEGRRSRSLRSKEFPLVVVIERQLEVA